MGFASPADERSADIVSVGEYLIRDKDASYLLQMQGDSMHEEGILDGDMIIFERAAEAKRGDLVVVLDDSGYTLKHYPAAGSVVGVVTGTFRKYK